ncbi:MAG: hypothetical protein RSA68_12780 [Hafnia sp.]|uniref:hypothetical protein n=1 Tax=Hafnia sp. TaxID=1873498 RepID=UPI002FC9A018
MVILYKNNLALFLSIILSVFFYSVSADVSAIPQDMQLRALVEESPIACKVGFDGDKGDYVNFGKITPSQINDAPTGGALSINDVFITSNFNNIYDSKDPLAVLTVSCSGEQDINPEAVKIQYGTSGQKAILSSQVNGYQLDSGPNQPFLAFALYARDKNSTSQGKLDQYILPGQFSPLETDSFITNGDVSSASILLYPALYWRDNTGKNTAPGIITTSIDFVVTIA